MRELLVCLAKALVDQPDKVEVEQFEEDDGTLVLELSVADDDYGQVIGGGGRTAQALRPGGTPGRLRGPPARARRLVPRRARLRRAAGRPRRAAARRAAGRPDAPRRDARE